MQQPAGCKAPPQAQQQVTGQLTFLFSKGGIVPLRRLHVIDGNEGGFSTLCQAHITGLQIGIDLVTECLDGSPLGFGIGFGDPRVFMEALYLVVKAEFHLTFFGRAGNRLPR